MNQTVGSQLNIPCLNFQRFIHSSIWPLFFFSRQHHRLSFVYVAVYGLSFQRAASCLLENSENLGIVMDDSTSFVLKTISFSIAGIVALLLSLLVVKEEGTMWPVFLVASFFLVLGGISLVLHALRSGVDALVVAYTVNPKRFAEENPILYHRFQRRAGMKPKNFGIWTLRWACCARALW